MNRKMISAFTPEHVICRLIASWCAFSFFMLITREDDFLQLGYAQNTSVWISLSVILLFFLAYSAIHILSKREETDSWLLLIGATLCVIHWLYKGNRTQNPFLFVMAVILAYGFFVMYFLQKNRFLFEQIHFKGKNAWWIGIIFGLLSGAMIAWITSLRYMTFSSPNFDFGIFVHMFHNMKETGLPDVSCERDVLMSHFAVHISPVYYLLLPFYVLFPSPLTLQIGQAAIVASGVVPVLLLCQKYKLSGKSSAAAAILYALHPALSTSCFFDIHENCFLAPLLLWTFYFFECKRYIPMYIFACFTLGVKEDAAVYILIFALYLVFSKRSFRHGVLLAFSASIYFCLALVILQKTSADYAVLYANQTPNPPIEGPMLNRFQNLIFEKEDGLLGAVKTIFLNPGFLLTQLFQTGGNTWDKIAYFFQMFLPLGFLPFFSEKISRLILVSPILINLLTNYSYQYNIGYQYHFGILAFFIYVSIMNLSGLQRSLRRNILGFAIAACFCFYVVYIPSDFVYYQKAWNENKEVYVQMSDILSTVPSEASVACPGYILPHIANRREVYELYYHGDFGDVDYVILDARFSVDEKQLENFLSQNYVVVKDCEGLLIILKKME